MAYHRIMKSKLDSDQQIQHIKSKGISFNYISEEDAKKYLEQSTYLFKLLSYRKNYLKDARDTGVEDKRGRGKTRIERYSEN